MATPVKIPKLGQSVESCIITEWFKKKGESISKGEPLFAYETDKASFEEEAPADGVVLEIYYEEGDEVPVLSNVAVIGKEGEETEEFKTGEDAVPSEGEEVIKESTESKAKVEGEKQEPVVSVREEKSPAEGPVKISPRAKNLAKELGINYQNIAGTGPGGRIIEQDIRKAEETGQLVTPLAAEKMRETGMAPAEEGTGMGGRITDRDLVEGGVAGYGEDFEVKKLSNVRKLIAQGMYNSLQNSAQLTHHMSADARNILALRKEVKQKLEEGRISENITLNDMVCYAVIKALKKHPDANVHFIGDAIRTYRKIHLGFAVDTERGLLVPVVRNADDLKLEGLSSRLKALAEKAKKGNIEPELINSQAATFTVSNLGAYGVEMFTPVLNVPQVGILGVNTIIHRPADLGNGTFGFIPFIGLSLTYDHRAIDGGPASLFLLTIKQEIESFQTSI